MESVGRKAVISEVLPKSGLVYSEKGGLGEILCKPKILPLKSAVLEQLQKLESQAANEYENPLDREFYKG
eukprot:gene44338-54220_t